MNRIRVASVYNAKKYLEQLPDEFKAVKVDSESLKPTVWRRFVRDLEKELNIPTAVFHKDAEADDFSDYLEKILRNQGFETDDFKHGGSYRPERSVRLVRFWYGFSVPVPTWY